MIGTTNATGEHIDGREARHDETVQQRRRLGTVKAGAEILAVGEKTVRRMIDAGKLPGVCRLGRLVRLDLDILDQWIAQGCPPLHRFNGKGAR
jgi:excisionase family DNA binding protein